MASQTNSNVFPPVKNIIASPSGIMTDNVDELKQQLERKIAKSDHTDHCGSHDEVSNIAKDTLPRNTETEPNNQSHVDVANDKLIINA